MKLDRSVNDRRWRGFVDRTLFSFIGAKNADIIRQNYSDNPISIDQHEYKRVLKNELDIVCPNAKIAKLYQKLVKFEFLDDDDQTEKSNGLRRYFYGLKVLVEQNAQLIRPNEYIFIWRVLTKFALLLANYGCSVCEKCDSDGSALTKMLKSMICLDDCLGKLTDFTPDLEYLNDSTQLLVSINPQTQIGSPILRDALNTFLVHGGISAIIDYFRLPVVSDFEQYKLLVLYINNIMPVLQPDYAQQFNEIIESHGSSLIYRPLSQYPNLFHDWTAAIAQQRQQNQTIDSSFDYRLLFQLLDHSIESGLQGPTFHYIQMVKNRVVRLPIPTESTKIEFIEQMLKSDLNKKWIKADLPPEYTVYLIQIELALIHYKLKKSNCAKPSKSDLVIEPKQHERDYCDYWIELCVLLPPPYTDSTAGHFLLLVESLNWSSWDYHLSPILETLPYMLDIALMVKQIEPGWIKPVMNIVTVVLAKVLQEDCPTKSDCKFYAVLASYFGFVNSRNIWKSENSTSSIYRTMAEFEYFNHSTIFWIYANTPKFEENAEILDLLDNCLKSVEGSTNQPKSSLNFECVQNLREELELNLDAFYMTGRRINIDDRFLENNLKLTLELLLEQNLNDLSKKRIEYFLFRYMNAFDANKLCSLILSWKILPGRLWLQPRKDPLRFPAYNETIAYISSLLLRRCFYTELSILLSNLTYSFLFCDERFQLDLSNFIIFAFEDLANKRKKFDSLTDNAEISYIYEAIVEAFDRMLAELGRISGGKQLVGPLDKFEFVLTRKSSVALNLMNSVIGGAAKVISFYEYGLRAHNPQSHSNHTVSPLMCFGFKDFHQIPHFFTNFANEPILDFTIKIRKAFDLDAAKYEIVLKSKDKRSVGSFYDNTNALTINQTSYEEVQCFVGERKPHPVGIHAIIPVRFDPNKFKILKRTISPALRMSDPDIFVEMISLNENRITRIKFAQLIRNSTDLMQLIPDLWPNGLDLVELVIEDPELATERLLDYMRNIHRLNLTIGGMLMFLEGICDRVLKLYNSEFGSIRVSDVQTIRLVESALEFLNWSPDYDDDEHQAQLRRVLIMFIFKIMDSRRSKSAEKRFDDFSGSWIISLTDNFHSCHIPWIKQLLKTPRKLMDVAYGILFEPFASARLNYWDYERKPFTHLDFPVEMTAEYIAELSILNITVFSVIYNLELNHFSAEVDHQHPMNSYCNIRLVAANLISPKVYLNRGVTAAYLLKLGFSNNHRCVSRMLEIGQTAIQMFFVRDQYMDRFVDCVQALDLHRLWLQMIVREKKRMPGFGLVLSSTIKLACNLFLKVARARFFARFDSQSSPATIEQAVYFTQNLFWLIQSVFDANPFLPDFDLSILDELMIFVTTNLILSTQAQTQSLLTILAIQPSISTTALSMLRRWNPPKQFVNQLLDSLLTDQESAIALENEKLDPKTPLFNERVLKKISISAQSPKDWPSYSSCVLRLMAQIKEFREKLSSIQDPEDSVVNSLKSALKSCGNGLAPKNQLPDRDGFVEVWNELSKQLSERLTHLKLPQLLSLQTDFVTRIHSVCENCGFERNSSTRCSRFVEVPYSVFLKTKIRSAFDNCSISEGNCENCGESTQFREEEIVQRRPNYIFVQPKFDDKSHGLSIPKAIEAENLPIAKFQKGISHYELFAIVFQLKQTSHHFLAVVSNHTDLSRDDGSPISDDHFIVFDDDQVFAVSFADFRELFAPQKKKGGDYVPLVCVYTNQVGAKTIVDKNHQFTVPRIPSWKSQKQTVPPPRPITRQSSEYLADSEQLTVEGIPEPISIVEKSLDDQINRSERFTQICSYVGNIVSGMPDYENLSSKLAKLLSRETIFHKRFDVCSKIQRLDSPEPITISLAVKVANDILTFFRNWSEGQNTLKSVLLDAKNDPRRVQVLNLIFVALKTAEGIDLENTLTEFASLVTVSNSLSKNDQVKEILRIVHFLTLTLRRSTISFSLGIGTGICRSLTETLRSENSDKYGSIDKSKPFHKCILVYLMDLIEILAKNSKLFTVDDAESFLDLLFLYCRSDETIASFAADEIILISEINGVALKVVFRKLREHILDTVGNFHKTRILDYILESSKNGFVRQQIEYYLLDSGCGLLSAISPIQRFERANWTLMVAAINCLICVPAKPEKDIDRILDIESLVALVQIVCEEPIVKFDKQYHKSLMIAVDAIRSKYSMKSR